MNRSFESSQLRRQAWVRAPPSGSDQTLWGGRKPVYAFAEVGIHPSRVGTNATVLLKTDSSQWFFRLRSLWVLKCFPAPRQTMLPCGSLPLSAKKRRKETVSPTAERDTGSRSRRQKTTSVQRQQSRATARGRGCQCRPIPCLPGRFKGRFIYLCTQCMCTRTQWGRDRQTKKDWSDSVWKLLDFY